MYEYSMSEGWLHETIHSNNFLTMDSKQYIVRKEVGRGNPYCIFVIISEPKTVTGLQILQQ